MGEAPDIRSELESLLETHEREQLNASLRQVGKTLLTVWRGARTEGASWNEALGVTTAMALMILHGHDGDSDTADGL